MYCVTFQLRGKSVGPYHVDIEDHGLGQYSFTIFLANTHDCAKLENTLDEYISCAVEFGELWRRETCQLFVAPIETSSSYGRVILRCCIRNYELLEKYLCGEFKGLSWKVYGF